MFWLLLIGFILLFLLSYHLFKKDLFAPSVIVSAVYCISGACALYNYNKWGLNVYHFKTVFLLLSAIIAFIVASYLTYYFYNKRYYVDYRKKPKDKKITILNLPKWLKISVFVIILATIGWKMYDVISVAYHYKDPKSFFDAIGIYRNIVSYKGFNITYSPPFLLNQLEKVVNIIAYWYMYIIIRNLFNKDKLKNNLSLIIYIALFGVYTILTGGRMPMLKLAGASIFFCYCFSCRNKKWQVNMSKKYIKVGIIAILVMFASFYLLHGIIGRNGKFNPDYYVTMYAGGPIKLFDMYVEKPVKKSNIIGKETFHSINSLLYKLKIVKTKYIKHLEFRRYNGLFLGNIYTPFRRYYADFGLVGMIILTSIVAILMNFFYLFSMNKIKNGHDLWMACYGLIIYGLFLYSINDEFFNVIFSVNYASLYILLIGFYFIYTRIIRKKWNR